MGVGKPQRNGAEVRSAATRERLSNRAQRKLAAEQAARRRRIIAILSGLLAVVVVAVVSFLVARPRPADLWVNSVPELAADIPVNGRTMGDPAASVTVVEWGDYQ